MSSVQTYLALGRNYQIERRPLQPQPAQYYGMGDNRHVSSSTTAPSNIGVSTQFTDTDFYRQIAISDLNFNSLMQRANFLMPNTGIKVITDGHGNVDSVTLAPSEAKFIKSPDIKEDVLAKRAKITQGAVFKVDSGSIPIPSYKKTATLTKKPVVQSNTLTPTNLPKSTPLAQTNRINFERPLPDLNALNQRNPVLERLIQKQPPTEGLNIAGVNSEISAETAQQIAANRARFNVNVDPSTQGKIQAIQQQALIQNGGLNPFNLAKIVDGKIPFTHLQAGNNKTSWSQDDGSVNSIDRLEQAADIGVKDSTAGRGGGSAYAMGMNLSSGNGQQGTSEGQSENPYKRGKRFLMTA